MINTFFPLLTQAGNGSFSPPAHSGWFKVEEQALRRIEASYDKPDLVRKAMLAYLTVCRVANLKGTRSFVKSGADWSRDMKLSYPVLTTS